MVLLYSSINYWTKCCILGFYLKHHECLLGFFIQLDIVMPFSSPQLELDWESMSNFLRLERNLHIFGHIFLAVSIFLFWPTKARETNVGQFPARSNFWIMNILSCSGVSSIYFPPPEVVHPVLSSVKTQVICPFRVAAQKKRGQLKGTMNGKKIGALVNIKIKFIVW